MPFACADDAPIGCLIALHWPMIHVYFDGNWLKANANSISQRMRLVIDFVIKFKRFHVL